MWLGMQCANNSVSGCVWDDDGASVANYSNFLRGWRVLNFAELRLQNELSYTVGRLLFFLTTDVWIIPILPNYCGLTIRIWLNFEQWDLQILKIQFRYVWPNYWNEEKTRLENNPINQNIQSQVRILPSVPALWFWLTPENGRASNALTTMCHLYVKLMRVSWDVVAIVYVCCLK